MSAFGSFLKGPFARRSDGTVSVNLSASQRDMIENLIEQLREMITTDNPALVRLFPPPYGDDEERNRGYAALAGSELIERRLVSMSTVMNTVHSEQLTDDQLQDWMRSLNDLRLVLGTVLDVSEDQVEVDDDDEPAQSMYLAYDHLGYLLERIVDVLSD